MDHIIADFILIGFMGTFMGTIGSIGTWYILVPYVGDIVEVTESEDARFAHSELKERQDANCVVWETWLSRPCGLAPVIPVPLAIKYH